METILAMILAAVTIGFVGYPLLRAKPQEGEEDVEPAPGDTIEDELEVQKESVYSAIAELDFDHAMGNLSDSDHQELRDRYKLKALTLMKQVDEVEKAAQAQRPPERRAPAPRPASQTEGRAFCSGCGAKLDHGDKFCASCGKPSVTGCPSCGTAYDPGDAFCSGCGRKM